MTQGEYNAWLTEPAAALDADEVQRRLADVPEAYREPARRHARTVWRVALRQRSP